MKKKEENCLLVSYVLFCFFLSRNFCFFYILIILVMVSVFLSKYSQIDSNVNYEKENKIRPQSVRLLNDDTINHQHHNGQFQYSTSSPSSSSSSSSSSSGHINEQIACVCVCFKSSDPWSENEMKWNETSTKKQGKIKFLKWWKQKTNFFINDEWWVSTWATFISIANKKKTNPKPKPNQLNTINFLVVDLNCPKHTVCRKLWKVN